MNEVGGRQTALTAALQNATSLLSCSASRNGWRGCTVDLCLISCLPDRQQQSHLCPGAADGGWGTLTWGGRAGNASRTGNKPAPRGTLGQGCPRAAIVPLPARLLRGWAAEGDGHALLTPPCASQHPGLCPTQNRMCQLLLPAHRDRVLLCFGSSCGTWETKVHVLSLCLCDFQPEGTKSTQG